MDLYISKGKMKDAAEGYDELAKLTTEVRASNEYMTQAAAIRAEICRKSGDEEGLIEQLQILVKQKTFAEGEYYELYSLMMSRSQKEDRLKLADEIIAYMNGHSSYDPDNRKLLSVIFDAAEVAGYTEWSRSEEDYFVLAEEILAKTEGTALTENEVLKYKVIIAERRGKMEVAYKLLGVYLNHCPDDEYAKKEMDYLENRLGLGQ